jgi:hypothetical protein
MKFDMMTDEQRAESAKEFLNKIGW